MWLFDRPRTAGHVSGLRFSSKKGVIAAAMEDRRQTAGQWLSACHRSAGLLAGAVIDERHRPDGYKWSKLIIQTFKFVSAYAHVSMNGTIITPNNKHEAPNVEAT